jgi:hypothetical protein
MKTRLAFFAGIVLAVVVGTARAEKPLKDYSFIRGVNYGMQGDQAVLERDLGYARRLNLNSTRIWLSYQGYEKDSKAYLDRLRNYIRTSQRLGFTTIPILWNGNSLNPDTLKPEFRARGDAYVKAIVEEVKNEPGLLMWDIMNEPFTNSNTMIKPVPNREGHAERALKAIEAALKDNQSAFGASKTPTDKILDAAEAAANLLEAAEMVPMYVPPTAQIRFWRQQPPEKRDRDAIRAFAYDLGLTLKKYCLLY